MNRKKAGIGIEGMFKGIADLVENIGKLAEKGEQISKSGEIKFN